MFTLMWYGCTLSVHVRSIEVVKKLPPCLGRSKSYTGAGSVYVSLGLGVQFIGGPDVR